MRVAWFSPFPPVRSGIAAASAELVEGLRGEHDIDVYVDEPQVKARTPGVMSAHDFVWRQRLRPYDLAVYQVGNSSHHDYMWPYLFRYPGLAVLHDAHLHHARAAALLRANRAAEYRAEFTAGAPDLPADMAEIAVAGFDSHLYYLSPMTRLVAAASRTVAVHTPALAAQLRTEVPGAAVEALRLGHGVALTDAQRQDARARGRTRLGIGDDSLVFGVFGGLTPEKRVPQVLSAFTAVLPYAPNARLLLAGAPASHYDVAADVRRYGLQSLVTITGYLETDAALTDAVAAADVALNLRWPTAREMSGPWLRALAAGVPTVTIDLWHTGHVPSLDPRTWQPNGDVPGDAPVTIALDILDEDHSLRLAMRRLASDAALRRSLGAAGRAYWEREHSVERMLDDYRHLLPNAAARPAGPGLDASKGMRLPAHLVTDGDRLLLGVLRDFGLEGASIWSTL